MAETEEIKFICPACKCGQLECVMDGIHHCEVTKITPDEFEYGEYESDGMIDRWQCLNCGYILTSEIGENLTENDEIVKWVKKYCKQE